MNNREFASTGTAEPMEDPRELIAREPMSRAQVLAVALATALNGLDGFDVLSISFAAPGIAADWGIDRAALGVVLSMELIGMGAGSILLGRAADRFGRRPLVLACLAIMTFGMALASTATNIQILSAYRLLTGLGIGGMLATTNAIVAEFANTRRRNLAVAIMAGGYPVGAVVGGTIVSAMLGSGATWHSIFHLGALLTLGFVPLVWFLLPETIAHLLQARRPDALHQVNAVLARMGRAPIGRLPDRGADSETRGGIAQLFSPALAVTTLMLTAGYFLHIMTFYFLVKWIPKLVVDFGFEASAAAGVLVWANVGGATGSLTLSLLTSRVSVRTLTMIWMIFGALSLVVFGQGAPSVVMISVVAAAGGFFLNGANVGLYAMFAQSFPARLRASGTGFIIGVGRGGAALGPIIGGLLLQAGLPVSMVAIAIAGGSIAASIVLLSMRYREQELA